MKIINKLLVGTTLVCAVANSAMALDPSPIYGVDVVKALDQSSSPLPIATFTASAGQDTLIIPTNPSCLFPVTLKPKFGNAVVNNISWTIGKNSDNTQVTAKSGLERFAPLYVPGDPRTENSIGSERKQVPLYSVGTYDIAMTAITSGKRTVPFKFKLRMDAADVSCQDGPAPVTIINAADISKVQLYQANKNKAPADLLLEETEPATVIPTLKVRTTNKTDLILRVTAAIDSTHLANKVKVSRIKKQAIFQGFAESSCPMGPCPPAVYFDLPISGIHSTDKQNPYRFELKTMFTDSQGLSHESFHPFVFDFNVLVKNQ